VEGSGHGNILKYYLVICMTLLRKTTKNSRYLVSVPIFNPGSPEYEARVPAVELFIIILLDFWTLFIIRFHQNAPTFPNLYLSTDDLSVTDSVYCFAGLYCTSQ
jgi:hypothetical protein